MATRIRVIYENGIFRPLEIIDFDEGKQIDIILQEVDEELEMLKSLLGEMVIWADPNADPNPEIEQYADEIDLALQGDPPLSQIIIEERGEIF